jgi:chemotaxis protein MotB
MSATAVLSHNTIPPGNTAEDPFPWDIETAPSVVESDTWLLSFIDILTLLLALFVLLLAQEHHINKTVNKDIHADPVRISIEPPMPTPEPEPAPVPRPFSAIQLPALPQIVTPLDTLQFPTPDRSRHSAELAEPEEAEPVIPELVTVVATQAELTPEADAKEVPLTQSTTETVAHTPVDDFLETLHSSGLADRIDIQTRTDSVRLDIADSILFAPARTTLTDSGLSLLQELAITLHTLPWSLSVEGHTDNIPIQTPRLPSNWQLSTARASVVARQLIQHGIRPDRIRAIGYADTRPRDNNETREGRNRNRRVTFVVELPENQ